MTTPRGPKVVAIGGGHGLSNMLRGLKGQVDDLTAIVTVADDGGGSGMLRQDLGMLPPGDIRNCMQSLANVEPVMSQLLAYRFTDGSLAGQSFGNLLLAALYGISDSFDQAVARMSQVLAISGGSCLSPTPMWTSRLCLKTAPAYWENPRYSNSRRSRTAGWPMCGCCPGIPRPSLKRWRPLRARSLFCLAPGAFIPA